MLYLLSIIVYIYGMIRLSKSKLRKSGLNYGLTVLFILCFFFPVMTTSYTSSRLYEINDREGTPYIALRSLNEDLSFSYLMIIGTNHDTRLTPIEVNENNLLIRERSVSSPKLKITTKKSIIGYFNEQLNGAIINGFNDKKILQLEQNSKSTYELIIPKGKVNKSIGFPKDINLYE